MISIYAPSLMLAFGFHLARGFFASCVHGGIKYEDGDYFLPNKTFIETENPLQCVQCRCNQGLVICEIEDCKILECENPIKHARFCCLRCSENLKAVGGSSDLIFRQEVEKTDGIPIANQAVDCVSSGRNYAHGSVWQPIIGPLGAMACVRCHCRKGNVICARIRCNDQPCLQPKREFGECCPICPVSEKEKNKLTALCLPTTSEIFVFKTPNVKNDSDKIEYAFFENKTENNAIAIFSWNLRAPRSRDTLVVKISSKNAWVTWNLTLLGSTSKKRFKKFKRRGERLKTKCYIQCLRKLERLENSLGIHPVASKSKCNQNETDVSNL